MKRRHDREDLEQELDRKAAAAAEGEVTERGLAEEDGAEAEAPAEAAAGPAPADEAKDRRIAELQDALLRQMAEFENFRRRTDREKERIRGEAVADVVGAWLPVLDNLERAAAVAAAGRAEDAAPVRDGIGQVLRQAGEAMARLGVEEIPSLGAPFDPNVHHAVQHVEDESAGAGVVVEVYQKGYRCGERIVRHSMVKVAN